MSSDEDEAPQADEMWKNKTGGPTAQERLRMNLMYDPRTENRHGKTLLGKMTEQARADKDMYKSNTPLTEDIEEASVQKLEEIRRACSQDDAKDAEDEGGGWVLGGCFRSAVRFAAIGAAPSRYMDDRGL